MSRAFMASTTDPRQEDERDPAIFIALRDAVMSRSDAERSIQAAIDAAREHGHSRAFIGRLPGTSGEAARHRYSTREEA